MHEDYYFRDNKYKSWIWKNIKFKIYIWIKSRTSITSPIIKWGIKEIWSHKYWGILTNNSVWVRPIRYNYIVSKIPKSIISQFLPKDYGKDCARIMIMIITSAIWVQPLGTNGANLLIDSHIDFVFAYFYDNESSVRPESYLCHLFYSRDCLFNCCHHFVKVCCDWHWKPCGWVCQNSFSPSEKQLKMSKF